MGELLEGLENKKLEAKMMRKEELLLLEENNINENKNEKQAPLIHFVLVHGIGGGAWCWYKVRCLLESSAAVYGGDGGGCKVTCLDLKGSGTDITDANSILSFADYNKPLVDFLASLPQDEQVILVGHSAGGLNVTDVCYKFPQKIRLAIYVTATMLKYGFKSQQDFKDGVPDLSRFGEMFEVNDVVFGQGKDKPPTTQLIKKQFQRKIIYQMSPLEDVTLAGMLLRPGPVQALLSARFEEGEDEVEKIPRVYIKSMQDNVISPEQQEAMIKRWPPTRVYSLECDHSPNFSAPFLLAGLLFDSLRLLK